MTIRELIELRTRKQNALNEIVSEYICRYIQKIYKSLDEKRTIHFQKVLLYISEWSDDRLLKFYDKFNRFVSKKNDTSYDLQKNLENVISLNIKIMLVLTHEKTAEIKSPEGYIFLYRCLRSVAKAYYNSPKYIHEDEALQLTLVSEIVELCLQKYIPTRELMEYHSENTEYLYEETEYETDTDTVSNSSNSSNTATIQKFVIDKTSNSESLNKPEEPVLKYLLKDEYYESEDDNIQNENDDVKQIMLMKKAKHI